MPMAILASRFQVIALLDLCERHLINCVELPVLDRLLFADKYGLVGLKVVLISPMEEHSESDMVRKISNEIFGTVLDLSKNFAPIFYAAPILRSYYTFGFLVQVLLVCI